MSKYENKFAKLQKKAGEFNLRSQLKNVKKKEFTMDEEEPGVRVFGIETARLPCLQARALTYFSLQFQEHVSMDE